MRATLTRAAASGIQGENSARNGRGASGSFLRSTSTPSETSAKANSVPMLTSCPRTPIGVRPATITQAPLVTSVVRCGVWNFGWMRAVQAGNPSCAMA